MSGRRLQRAGTRKSASKGAAEDLRELHELFGEG